MALAALVPELRKCFNERHVLDIANGAALSDEILEQVHGASTWVRVYTSSTMGQLAHRWSSLQPREAK